MTDQEKIAWFLIFKANRFNFVEGGAEYAALYFKKEDLEDVSSWSNKMAYAVWMLLVGNVVSGAARLESDTCPFCLRSGTWPHSFCRNCSYAKNHKICGRNKSDFSIIAKWMTLLSFNVNEELFSNEVYKEIINIIENG